MLIKATVTYAECVSCDSTYEQWNAHKSFRPQNQWTRPLERPRRMCNKNITM